MSTSSSAAKPQRSSAAGQGGSESSDAGAVPSLHTCSLSSSSKGGGEYGITRTHTFRVPRFTDSCSSPVVNNWDEVLWMKRHSLSNAMVAMAEYGSTILVLR